jgi:DNA-binding MarR family transcriptional regulator
MEPDSSIAEVRKASQQHAYISLQLHEAIARKAGFSGTDQKYLGFFLQRGSLTAGELAALTGLTTGAVTGLIDRFAKKKLVKRQLDKADRRKVLVVPDTEKIEALLQPFYASFQTATEELIASFAPAERDAIGRFLQQSIALMKETKEKVDP